MAEEKRFNFGDLSVIGAIAVFIVGVLLAADVNIVTAVPGVIRILRDPNYIAGFGLMWLQVIGVSAVGGGVGVALGALVFRSKYLTRSAIPFLRYAQWLPIFAYSVFLPAQWIVQYGKGLPRGALFVIWGVQIASPAVMLAACYYYVSLRSVLEHKSTREGFGGVLLRAFLICLWWQTFFHPYGWGWNTIFDVDRALAGILLIALSVAVIDLLAGASFEQVANARAASITSETEKGGRTALYGASLLVGMFLVLWQLLQTPVLELFRIPPPTSVLEAAYRLAFVDATLWTDIRVSLLEIGGGLVLAAIPAFLISRVLALQTSFRRLTEFVLSLTNLTLMGFWLLSFLWLGIGAASKVALIGALTFYPLVQTLWGLRHLPVVARLALSLDEALPYAFAGMFFGELYAATVGLGFSIVVFNAIGRPSGAMAVSLVIMTLLVGISVALRWIAKSKGRGRGMA